MFGRRTGNNRRVRWRRAGAVMLGVLVAVSLVLFSVSRVLAGPPNWAIILSPNPTVTENCLLDGVAAISAHDVWAVGNYADQSTTIQQTLTEVYH